MVGIPRVALVAVVGALPFVGALLAKDAPGESAPAPIEIAGEPIAQEQLDAERPLADVVRQRWLELEARRRGIFADEVAAALAATAPPGDTEAFDYAFTSFTERYRSVTRCLPAYATADVCGEDPAPAWWMGAATIRRDDDRWSVEAADGRVVERTRTREQAVVVARRVLARR